MASTDGLIFQSEHDLKAELVELRKGLLPMFVPLMLSIGWGWFAQAIFVGEKAGFPEGAVLCSLLATYLVWALSGKHHTLACWVLVLSMVLLQSLLIMAHPNVVIMLGGVLVVVTAHALLGTRSACMATALAWGIPLAVLDSRMGTIELGWVSIGILVLFYLTLLACWIASRPVATTVGWALSGWQYANEALVEARRRRGELARALRALEEATYRIERMNNELIIARREAEEARALKARLAATVSHELRGPLSLILGFSKLMALSPESYSEPLPPTYRSDVHTIYRNCQHLVSLVDDILDLSQIEAQRLPLVKDKVELEQDVVRKIVDIVQPLAERKGLYLRQELAGSLPWVLADKVRLRQALLNLLTNAVRFTERGGIAVRTSQDGDRLIVSVQDTGPGIAPEEMPRLFQEFSMVGTADRGEIGGSGLGLSISKHLIELHGGQIWLESQPGRGTTFHFSVPLPGTEPSSLANVRTEETPRRPYIDRTCLVIHDDPAAVTLLARYIEGYHVVGLPDTEDAMALVDELHPRAIVTTPEIGLSLEAELSHAPFDVPIITCRLPRSYEQNPGEGVISYLVKPVSSEMLAAAMKRVERDGETTILLVDDDPDAVRLLELLLTTLPRAYHIVKAYDGRQALEVMETLVPDIVFMDLVMPELDGEQTIASMRARAQLRNVPIVIISAHDRVEGRATLGTPISVHCREAVEIAQGARCLRALLDALNPRYLPEPGGLVPSAGESAGRSASEAPGLHPTPTRAGVG